MSCTLPTVGPPVNGPIDHAGKNVPDDERLPEALRKKAAGKSGDQARV